MAESAEALWDAVEALSGRAGRLQRVEDVDAVIAAVAARMRNKFASSIMRPESPLSEELQRELMREFGAALDVMVERLYAARK